MIYSFRHAVIEFSTDGVDHTQQRSYAMSVRQCVSKAATPLLKWNFKLKPTN